MNKKNKYNATKTIVDNITFDSKTEANRYCELKILVKTGIIKDLVLQPKFELVPKFRNNRAITYKADFMYQKENQTIVEDVKGYETKEFKLKKKLFEYKYQNIIFKIVK